MRPCPTFLLIKQVQLLHSSFQLENSDEGLFAARCVDNCMIGAGSIIGAGVHLVSENVADKTIVFSGGSANSKPITRKLGLLTVEEALETHNLHRTTIAQVLES